MKWLNLVLILIVIVLLSFIAYKMFIEKKEDNSGKVRATTLANPKSGSSGIYSQSGTN